MSIFRSSKLIPPSINFLHRAPFGIVHKLAMENQKQELSLDNENCIVVDSNDKSLGFASKRDCHRVDDNQIKLHRAFSVFIFNTQGDMLLQKRSSHKVKKKAEMFISHAD